MARKKLSLTETDKFYIQHNASKPIDELANIIGCDTDLVKQELEKIPNINPIHSNFGVYKRGENLGVVSLTEGAAELAADILKEASSKLPRDTSRYIHKRPQ